MDIVGHSLGGLIAPYYVQRLGGDRRVRTLVTLGTPHSGTRVAPLLDAHPLVRQMRPDSEVIEELAGPRRAAVPASSRSGAISTRSMIPLETARIEHPDLMAQNVQVTGIGHLALPVHPAVIAAGSDRHPRLDAGPAAVTGSRRRLRRLTDRTTSSSNNFEHKAKGPHFADRNTAECPVPEI